MGQWGHRFDPRPCKVGWGSCVQPGSRLQLGSGPWPGNSICQKWEKNKKQNILPPAGIPFRDSPGVFQGVPNPHGQIRFLFFTVSDVMLGVLSVSSLNSMFWRLFPAFLHVFPGVLALVTGDLWPWAILCGGGCPRRCRSCSIPGLHPLGHSGLPLF